MPRQVRIALTLFRIGTATVMVIHGVARARLGIVDDFGVALSHWGFPAGFMLAWTITAVEIAGGGALAAGRLVRPLALWFVFQLAMGVYLIHGRAGWFVVGAGRNGVQLPLAPLLHRRHDERARRVRARSISKRRATWRYIISTGLTMSRTKRDRALQRNLRSRRPSTT